MQTGLSVALSIEGTASQPGGGRWAQGRLWGAVGWGERQLRAGVGAPSEAHGLSCPQNPLVDPFLDLKKLSGSEAYTSLFLGIRTAFYTSTFLRRLKIDGTWESVTPIADPATPRMPGMHLHFALG